VTAALLSANLSVDGFQSDVNKFRTIFEQLTTVYVRGIGYILTSGLKFDCRLELCVAECLRKMKIYQFHHVLGHFWSIFNCACTETTLILLIGVKFDPMFFLVYSHSYGPCSYTGRERQACYLLNVDLQCRIYA